jgi:putrescine transport system substrate-binding protein
MSILKDYMHHNISKSLFSFTFLLMLSITFVYANKNSNYICNNEVLKTNIYKFDETKQINYVNWVNYMSPDIISCYSQLSSSRVKYTFASNDSMTRAKIMTGTSGFDIAGQGVLHLPTEIKSNALLPLDKTKLPNLKYKNETLYNKVSSIADQDNNYGIIYSYGTVGIAYNKTKTDKILGDGIAPDSWEYIFNPEKLKLLSNCGISLLDEPEQIFGNYFFYKGIDPNTTNKADYEEAALYLMKNVRPYVKYFDSSKYQNDFTAGNLCMVLGYSGDVIRSVAKAQKVNPSQSLKYIIPKEGTNIWFDMLVIPKDAKNLDNIYSFLNYLLDPYVAAMNAIYLYQPSAVNGSAEYLTELFNDHNVNPTNEEIDNMYFLELQPDLQLRSFINRMWINVKRNISFTPQYYKPDNQ